MHDVLVGADNRLGFYDAGERIRELRFDDAAARLVGLGDTSVHVWDQQTHELLASYPLGTELAEYAASFNQSTTAILGRWVGWTDAAGIVGVLDLAEGGRVHTLGSGADLAFTADGSAVAVSGTGGQIDVYDLPDFTPRWSSPGDGFTTLGEQLAAHGLPSLDAFDSRLLPASLAFSNDAAVLYLGRDHTLTAFDARSGTLLATSIVVGPEEDSYPDIVANHLTPLDDGSDRLLIGGGVFAQVIEGRSLVRAREVMPEGDQLTDFVQSWLPLPSDQLAFLRSSGTLVIADSVTGARIGEAIDAQVGQSSTIAVSDDGRRLAVGGAWCGDRCARRFRADTRRRSERADRWVRLRRT